MKRAVEIRIFGKVFNVGFRRYVHRYAIENNIAGYVENELVTGSVHIIAQGEDHDLDAFFALCKHGTPYSVVERVEVAEVNLIDFVCFEQKR